MKRRRGAPFLLDAEDVQTPAGQREAVGAARSPTASAIFDEDEIRPLPEEQPATAPSTGKPTRAPRRAIGVFVATAAVFIVSLLAIETASYIFALFDRHPALGALLGILAIVVVTSGIVAVGWETIALRRQLRSLSEVAELRDEAARILDDPTATGQGGTLTARVIALYDDRPELAGGIERLRRTVTTAHSDAETLSLLAHEVLRPLDIAAYRIVSRAARDTGLGVALSPAGLLDAVLVIWRTSRMIRDVALVYGFRPTRIGRLALTRRVLENAAMAGAVEYFGDFLTAQIGAGLASRVSRKVGQGAFTALRTARLGVIAIEACRPIPFTTEDRAGLAALRREIMNSFRGQESRSE